MRGKLGLGVNIQDAKNAEDGGKGLSDRAPACPCAKDVPVNRPRSGHAGKRRLSLRRNPAALRPEASKPAGSPAFPVAVNRMRDMGAFSARPRSVSRQIQGRTLGRLHTFQSGFKTGRPPGRFHCIDGSIHVSFTRTRNPVPEGGLQSIDDKLVRCCRSCPESEDIHLPSFRDGRGDQHHHLPLLP